MNILGHYIGHVQNSLRVENSQLVVDRDFLIIPPDMFSQKKLDAFHRGNLSSEDNFDVNKYDERMLRIIGRLPYKAPKNLYLEEFLKFFMGTPQIPRNLLGWEYLSTNIFAVSNGGDNIIHFSYSDNALKKCDLAFQIKSENQANRCSINGIDARKFNYDTFILNHFKVDSFSSCSYESKPRFVYLTKDWARIPITDL